MIEFARTTPFQLARRLTASGQDGSTIYLVIAEQPAIGAVQADLVAEIDVQLGIKMRSVLASEIPLDKVDEAFKEDRNWAVLLVIFDRWLPKLVESIDRNVVLLSRPGSVLLLATFEVTERILTAAPNLRSRLADVLVIQPEEGFGGARD